MDFNNSPDFEELYQSIILDHSRRPRNFGELPDATVTASGDNPTCGDQITLQLRLGANDHLDDVKFSGDGCSICIASAPMTTTKVKGKPRADAEALRREFQAMLVEPTASDDAAAAAAPSSPSKALGDLRLLQGVRKFPQRIKCATLAWHALRQALSKDDSAAKSLVVDVEGNEQSAAGAAGAAKV